MKILYFWHEENALLISALSFLIIGNIHCHSLLYSTTTAQINKDYD